MRLHATIDLPLRRIEYDFEPASGSHWVSVHDGILGLHRVGSPGEAINHLAPFRGNSDVDELIAWLAR